MSLQRLEGTQLQRRCSLVDVRNIVIVVTASRPKALKLSVQCNA